MTRKTIKVRVTVTVEVDPDNWWMASGTDREHLRTDVADYVREQVQGSAATEEEAITDVWLRC